MRILILEGDGIGPEITAATEQVLRSLSELSGCELQFERADIGWKAHQEQGTTFPPAVLEKARGCDGVVLGPVSHNEYPAIESGGLNPSGELRKRLDLFANIRPARSREGLACKCASPVDLVIVRENTEGFYADRSMFTGPGEMMPTPDLALSFRKVTRAASMRIARIGFELAMTRRRKITVVHKANVLRTSDGLFLECTRAVAKDFPEVAYEEQLIDAMAALLVRDASVFDVIVTTNMFGDILSDEASEIIGGLGLGGSLNQGRDHAVAQAQHGSAPDLAGKDAANPSSLISSAAMLMQWLGATRANETLARAGAALDRALDDVIANPATRTADLGGRLGTTAFTREVIAAMGRQFRK